MLDAGHLLQQPLVSTRCMWRNRLNFCKKPCNLNQYKFLIEAFAYCRVQSLRTIIKNLYTKVMLASWYHLYLALFRRLLLFNPFHPKTSSQGTLVFYTSEVALRDVLSCITRRKCLSLLEPDLQEHDVLFFFFFFRAKISILVLELTCFFFPGILFFVMVSGAEIVWCQEEPTFTWHPVFAQLWKQCAEDPGRISNTVVGIDLLPTATGFLQVFKDE